MSRSLIAGAVLLSLVASMLTLPVLFADAAGISLPGSAVVELAGAGVGNVEPAGAGGDCAPAVGCQAHPPGLWYVPAGWYPDSFTDPPGQCTSWAAALWPGHAGRGVTWSGDAGDWLARAAAQGYALSSTPSLGAIAVWPRDFEPGVAATRYGHVAVVSEVTAATYSVTEMNVLGTFRVDTRTIALPGDQAGFIPLPADAF